MSQDIRFKDFSPTVGHTDALPAGPWPEHKPKPVFLVHGAGAVGGYYGAKLALGGFPTYMTARGAHLAAIRERGLRITGMIGDVVVRPPADSDPAAFGITPDYILMGVKSMDTAASAEQLAPVMGPGTQILAIQNGVENYRILADRFGADRVLRGYCRVGSEIVEPGHIHQAAFGQIIYGEEDGRLSPRVMRAHGALTAAGVESKPSTAIAYEVWKKFLWNSLFNMPSGLLGVTLDHLFRSADTERVLHGIFAEVRAGAATEGVTLTETDLHDILDATRPLQGYRTSTMQDRVKGKPLEYDAFVGYLSRLGKKHGFPTPVSDLLNDLYKMI